MLVSGRVTGFLFNPTSGLILFDGNQKSGVHQLRLVVEIYQKNWQGVENFRLGG